MMFLFPDTISFFSLFIRVKEGRGVLEGLKNDNKNIFPTQSGSKYFYNITTFMKI